jgi:hypothetical protein
MSTAVVSGLERSFAEFEEATERVRALDSSLSDEAWRKRPAEGKWSAVECIEHLNMTTRAYLPLFDSVMQDAERGTNYILRMDLFGWLLWRANRPKSKMRMKTAPHFVPPSDKDVVKVVTDFHELQSRLLSMIKQLESYPIGKLKVRSPFNQKIKYNVYSAIRILSVHELRHIAQAEVAAG